MPQAPQVPYVQMPQIPQMPQMPQMPQVPQMPQMPELPAATPKSNVLPLVLFGGLLVIAVLVVAYFALRG
jgi:hypothetical protein